MRALTLLLVVLMITAGLAAAAPQSAEKGLSNACERARSDKPCEKLRIIPDTQVSDTRSYSNGTYQAEGTVEVLPGGTVVVDNATVRFGDESAGFIVHAGGTLRITTSRLEEASGGSEFGIDARPGSAFVLVNSEIFGGSGIALQTDDAEIHHDTIANIPVALRNTGVSVEVHHVHFLDNDVSVNNTGGAPTLHNNTFQGGTVCVRDWLSDPTIVFNTFRGCHTGIYHHRSESKLSWNDLEDEVHEPGVGILVEDTMSPEIKGNSISRYGTGIVIRNARAFVIDNAIHHNVGHGVYVESNSAPMNITGNHIFENGGPGIGLVNVTDIDVRDNLIEDNDHSGVVVQHALSTTLVGNLAFQNAGIGFQVAHSPGIHVGTNNASGNAVDGFAFTNTSGAVLSGNSAWGNGGNGIAVIASQSVEVQGGSSGQNAQQGYYFGTVDGLELSNAFSSGNLQHGFLFSGGSITVSGIVAKANQASGIWALNASGTLFQANASHNAQAGFLVQSPPTAVPSIALSFAVAIGNAGDGVHHHSGGAFEARFGWYEGNGAAGVRNSVTAQLDAEHSYWGSSTGPTHPDNPGGTGDEVVGNVDYEPFAESPPGPALIA